MTIKQIWTKARSRTSGWLIGHRLAAGSDSLPQINEQGLISTDAEVPEEQPGSDQAAVAAIEPAGSRTESLERLQADFGRLIGQLEGINEHLKRQGARHEELMGRLDKLPELLESFPASAENQKNLTEQLLEHLKSASVKNEQFVDAVEKIPSEVARQSDSLSDINHQLAAAADADVQLAESFNKFNQMLDKLDKTTASQSDSIVQMSKTYAAGDRYLKYILSRQRRTFVWVFVIAMGICTAAILILAGIIVYLRR